MCVLEVNVWIGPRLEKKVRELNLPVANGQIQERDCISALVKVQYCRIFLHGLLNKLPIQAYTCFIKTTFASIKPIPQ
ncbi:hypothetical protein PG996_004493 [Apiospora saccharicola]|uniref:Uncharacterized protein n=1 Tax=Apiospora saccharicola TaxID=335842 RepID=A0ABR1W4E1_9PEZI